MEKKQYLPNLTQHFNELFSILNPNLSLSIIYSLKVYRGSMVFDIITHHSLDFNDTSIAAVNEFVQSLMVYI